jgi:uncharacterized membrane protein
MCKAPLKKKSKLIGVRRDYLPEAKAQSTVELTLVLIVCVIFLLGIAKIFVWVNRTLVERQERFLTWRRMDPVAFISFDLWKDNFYKPPKLDIFGENKD